VLAGEGGIDSSPTIGDGGILPYTGVLGTVLVLAVIA
jgi:hypothetical protein